MSSAELPTVGDRKPRAAITAAQWEHCAGNVYVCRCLVCPEEEGGFSIHALDLPGVASQGETAEEALENMKEAFAGAISVYRADCVGIPWGAVEVEDAPKDSREFRILVNV